MNLGNMTMGSQIATMSNQIRQYQELQQQLLEVDPNPVQGYPLWTFLLRQVATEARHATDVLKDTQHTMGALLESQLIIRDLRSQVKTLQSEAAGSELAMSVQNMIINIQDEEIHNIKHLTDLQAEQERERVAFSNQLKLPQGHISHL